MILVLKPLKIWSSLLQARVYAHMFKNVLQNWARSKMELISAKIWRFIRFASFLTYFAMVFSSNFKLNVLFKGKTWNIFENMKLFFRFVEKKVGVNSFQPKLPLLIITWQDWIMIALCTNIFLVKHVFSYNCRGLGLW